MIWKKLLQIQSPAQVQKTLLNRKFVQNYSHGDVATALVMKSISSKCFECVRKKNIVCLPNRQTLEKWLQHYKCLPGVQDEALHILVDLFLNKEKDMESYSILSFDDMDINKIYEYDTRSKTVFGPVKKVQIGMIRGLMAKWNSPSILTLTKR